MNTSEIRQQLEGLEGEYAEIQTLLTKERAHLRQLEGEGIKAFDQVITAQGRVGALERMEAEQATRVEQAKEALRASEKQDVREEHLAFIGACSQEIKAARADLLAHRDALYAALVELLPPILAASDRWGTARKAWMDRASMAGIRVVSLGGDEAATKALYRELEEKGVDTAPLRWPRGSGYEVQGSVPAPAAPYPVSDTEFGPHLDQVVESVIDQGGVILARIRHGMLSGGSTSARIEAAPIVPTSAPLALKTDPAGS
ncbi:hypothetical protein [Deinococcus sedimenti]|uniref:Uncharacterized protein n=1 Tax=Deinococcus sedimenti TaxID=1867090 RepID=A0ABQ2S9B0_9DEIO|nr:hypothetical protein [Deinococcus sedimenti]GGS10850.1 hypothetical protein GCM10008960_41090 [Deinococcus sedimenti]